MDGGNTVLHCTPITRFLTVFLSSVFVDPCLVWRRRRNDHSLCRTFCHPPHPYCQRYSRSMAGKDHSYSFGVWADICWTTSSFTEIGTKQKTEETSEQECMTAEPTETDGRWITGDAVCAAQMFSACSYISGQVQVVGMYKCKLTLNAGIPIVQHRQNRK